MIHNILNIKAAVTYVPYQDLENKFMLLGLLNQPEEFANHMRRYTNSLTTQMVFGFRTIDINDPKLQQLFHVSSSRAHFLSGEKLGKLTLVYIRALRNGQRSLGVPAHKCSTCSPFSKDFPSSWCQTTATQRSFTRPRRLCTSVTG